MARSPQAGIPAAPPAVDDEAVVTPAAIEQLRAAVRGRPPAVSGCGGSGRGTTRRTSSVRT